MFRFLLKNLKWSEMETSKMYLFLGLFVCIRASYFILRTESAFTESNFYIALDDFIPLPVIGVLLSIFGVSYIISSFLIPSQKYFKTCNILILSSSLLGFFIYFIMASASIFTAINYISTGQFLILSTWSLTNAFTSWGELYGRRK